MKNIKKILKILWIAINLLLVFFLFFVLSVMFQAVNSNGNYLILIPTVLVAILLIFFYKQFSNQLIYIIINENRIKLYKPLKLQKISLEWEEIKGYSISEFCYGRNLYSSKSFIIYPKIKREIEVINLYNLKFEEAFESLKKHQITKLGNEPYLTRLWKRKYKF